MIRRLELFALGFSFIGYVLSACNSGTGLTNGGSANTKKKEKKETSLDAKEPSGTGSDTGDENKRPAKEGSSADHAENDDADLSVIPPEVVSAAYLTCTTKQTGTTPEPEQIHLGCIVTRENGAAFPKFSASQQWSLKDSTGAPVEYVDIDLPEASVFHKIYGLNQKIYEDGVDPVVDIKTSDESVIPVKKKGVIRIGGKIVE